MKRAQLGISFVLLLSTGFSPLFAETQWIDVVQLRDGTTLAGIIVEQVAGESVRLATEGQVVLTLPQREVESIEKVETEQTYPLAFKDVLFLKDGVIFRGLLVEQRPEVELVLKTDNGLLLGFRMEEIWKILKEKRLIGKMREEKPAADSVGTLKIVLRIERGAKAIQDKQREEQSGNLEEQIEGLKEGLDELENEQAAVEQELAADQIGSEREQIEQACRRVEELLQELEQGLEACGPAQAQAGFRARQQPVAMQLSQASLNPSVKRLQEGLAEIRSRIAAKLPSDEEIRALEETQQARARVVEWLTLGDWRKSPYEPKSRDLAERLPIEERQFLYSAYAKHSGWLGFGLNTIPALQLGSWAQGNGRGALWGYLHLGGLSIAGAVGGAQLHWWITRSDGSTYDAGVYTGMIIGASVSYVLSLLQPLYYQSRWNRRLAEVLQLPEGTARRRTKQAVLMPPSVSILRLPEEGLRVNLGLVSLAY